MDLIALSDSTIVRLSDILYIKRDSSYAYVATREGCEDYHIKKEEMDVLLKKLPFQKEVK